MSRHGQASFGTEISVEGGEASAPRPAPHPPGTVVEVRVFNRHGVDKDERAQAIERMGSRYPEFDRLFTVVGNPTVAQGNVFYRALPWEERKRTTLEIAREITPMVSSLPGVTAFPISPPSLGQGFRERPLNFVIMSNDSYQSLAGVVRALQGRNSPAQPVA